MSFFNDLVTTNPGTGLMADGSHLLPYGTYIRCHNVAGEGRYARIVGTDGIYTRYSVLRRTRDFYCPARIDWDGFDEWAAPGEFDVVDEAEATSLEVQS